MHAILHSTTRPSATGSLTQSLASLATDPVDQLRLTAVIGELEGRHAALEYLKHINDSVPPDLKSR